MIDDIKTTITFAELLELFQQANALVVFPNREVHAYLDDHDNKKQRHVYRLPAERRYATLIRYCDFDETRQRWTHELTPTTTLEITSSVGQRLIDQWLNSLPSTGLQHQQIQYYVRDAKGWRVDLDYYKDW